MQSVFLPDSLDLLSLEKEDSTVLLHGKLNSGGRIISDGKIRFNSFLVIYFI